VKFAILDVNPVVKEIDITHAGFGTQDHPWIWHNSQLFQIDPEDQNAAIYCARLHCYKGNWHLQCCLAKYDPALWVTLVKILLQNDLSWWHKVAP